MSDVFVKSIANKTFAKMYLQDNNFMYNGDLEIKCDNNLKY